MNTIPDALKELTKYNQFILWGISIRDGKKVKLPINFATGLVCNAHDPTAWLSFEAASMLATAERRVGFVFTDEDPFFFLDIDGCITPEGWSPIAHEVIKMLPGASIEISQSGKGIHIIGSGKCPAHSCKNIALGLELYTGGRFIALTGDRAVGDAAHDCSAELPAVVAKYFPPSAGSATPAEWTDTPCEGYTGPADNTELIKRALASTSAAGIFGGRASFAALYTADAAALGTAYPDQSGAWPYNASSADAALAQHLAFWTGKNCERMRTLMDASALKREKWDREDYLPRTILRAVGLQRSVYGSTSAKPKATVAAPQLVGGFQYLTASMQLEHFKGCVYVQSLNKIFTPEGTLLNAERFNASYGGFSFQLDDDGKKTTRKAWDAFTESQCTRFPRAHNTCFRPRCATGELIKEEGQTLVNVYFSLPVHRVAGDPEPFLTHLHKMLPKKHDSDILLAYMAACVQHIGVKFQWAPLLQGTEGNGKTLFTRCVAAAIGQRYTHMPPASEVSEKFNEWLFYKLFIGIEDIYIPGDKREMIEILKPMITNDRLAMRAMQQSQVMGDNCANFMLNTNHKDAIQKTKNDRRFCVFYTAQQTADDLTRDGMRGEYFPKLYSWLRDGGYAIVTDYLMSYAIPNELNPATDCHRAPDTTSTGEALTSSLGGVEQEILEAIEQGRPGFAGGWVSSIAIERLLAEMRLSRALPQNKRRDIMRAIGYDWHPALEGGRLTIGSAIDGGKKPRVYIREGHLARNLSGAAEISAEYQKAQGGEVTPAKTIFSTHG